MRHTKKDLWPAGDTFGILCQNLPRLLPLAPRESFGEEKRDEIRLFLINVPYQIRRKQLVRTGYCDHYDSFEHAFLMGRIRASKFREASSASVH